jgi:hypothetical protein
MKMWFQYRENDEGRLKEGDVARLNTSLLLGASEQVLEVTAHAMYYKSWNDKFLERPTECLVLLMSDDDLSKF